MGACSGKPEDCEPIEKNIANSEEARKKFVAEMEANRQNLAENYEEARREHLEQQDMKELMGNHEEKRVGGGNKYKKRKKDKTKKKKTKKKKTKTKKKKIKTKKRHYKNKYERL